MPIATTPTVFGSFELVSFPQFGIIDTVAKIDTGAYSGALHCSYVEEVTRKNGKKVLRFVPSDNESYLTETSDYEVTSVRSSNGHESARYVIMTEIVVNGQSYPIAIGLTNREKMQREVLIGRRFLRENNILVDTRINKEYDTDKEGEKNE